VKAGHAGRSHWIEGDVPSLSSPSAPSLSITRPHAGELGLVWAVSDLGGTPRNVIVVDYLEAVTAFVELGLELEGVGTVEGHWVDRMVGLDGVRNDIAMLWTLDGHGRLELIKFHTPPATSAEPNAPV
jgi:hypothetical protein